MHYQLPCHVTSLIRLSAALLFIPLCAFSTEQRPDCKIQSLDGKVISLSECNSATDANDPETSIRTFITAHATDLKLPKNGFDLQLLSHQQTLQGQFSRFQIFINGYPVHNAIISVYQDKSGVIRRVLSADNTTIIAKTRSLQTKSANKISSNQAEQIALQVLKAQAQGVPDLKIVEHPQKIWYSAADNSTILAWKMLIVGENPLGDFVMIIDASNGKVLSQQNRLEFFEQGQGKVFLPNPVQSTGNLTLTDNNDANSPLLTSQLVTVTLLGLDESKNNQFLLTGQFVDVTSLKPQEKYPNVNQANQANRQYFYTRDDPRFEQVMAYYAIDSYQRYLQALGYNNANPTANGLRQAPIKANVHWNNEEFSFYRPSDQTLHFGDGGVDDAEDADIIVHEYGHAIQHAQFSDWGCETRGDNHCEMRAMGEGFADYIAADFHAQLGNKAYQSKNVACIGEWDGTAYSKTIPTCLRRVDENKHYPEDLKHKRNADSALWSRALWDIRAALGSNIANQIIIEHHYALPIGAKMPLAAQEVLNVDAELFGGFHETALRKAFCDRGILNKLDCLPPKHKKITLYVDKDSTINQADSNSNQGTAERLKVSGTSRDETRILLGFNAASIDVKKVKSAVVELSISKSDAQWGRFGRTLDIHPLRTNFSEGIMGDPQRTLWWPLINNAPGVTWNCPIDTDTSNHNRNCSSPWSGGGAINTTFGQGSSIPVVQTNSMTGKVRWTVTDDFKAGIRRWLIKKTFPETGSVDYYSQEGARKQGDKTLAPRLVITFK